jgi:two-component system OmpR family response regulator
MARPKSKMAKRVLLVDDEPTVTRVCAEMLEAKGYVVGQENHPRHALAAAQQFRPDVVVLDFMMPEMNGADVAWLFACSEEFRHTPLIVLTGFPAAAKRSTLPPGEVQILGKPIAVDVLVEAIEACTADTQGEQVPQGE